jgi:UDP-N-acetylmuramate--alanine ligase
LVTDVYAAREGDNSFSSAQVVEKMSHPAARHVGSLAAAGDTLLAELEPGDVVLVLSAGDADQVSARLCAQLYQREVNHG